MPKTPPSPGPVYGFIDRWASLLAVPRDSLDRTKAAAYGDSGVPRLSNAAVLAELQNYAGGLDPNGNPPYTTGALAAKTNGIGDPSTWKLERMRGGALLLRVPGLEQGLRVEAELFDLTGKRAGYWALQSEHASLRLELGGRSGAYLLKLSLKGFQGVKRIVL